jgi:DNA-binding NarL/FixJ family response regulator
MTPSRARPRPRAATRPAPTRNPRIRIVVADGHAIDRHGLVSLLRGQPDFECVGEAAHSAEAIERCAGLRPAVLVLTLNLPGDSGDSALPVIHAALPGLRILAISERGVANCLVLNPPARSRLAAYSQAPRCEAGNDCLQLAMAQGALGTLRRSAEPDSLFRAVRAVAAGQTSYEPRTGMMFSRDGIGAGTNGNLGLSVREMDVAVLLAEGQSNKEISGLLSISEPTVKKHVGQILKKLDVQDRLQAGLFVARHPLLFSRNGAASG